ncbi:hypothetical protein ABZ871_33945 [Streptomyces populi]
MTDYLRAVLDMIGPPENRYADPAAWARLESELGTELPADYKTVVDAYAPIQINGHLFLSHPATSRWNLPEKIRSTSQAYAQYWVAPDSTNDPESDPRQICELRDLAFGTPQGLIPLASTDRGETVFLAPRVHGFPGGMCVAGGDGDWAGYPMPFAEWLYRFLIGEDMAGYKSAVFYPGPVMLESMPMTPDEPIRVSYGPERGM